MTNSLGGFMVILLGTFACNSSKLHFFCTTNFYSLFLRFENISYTVPTVHHQDNLIVTFSA